MNQKLLQIEQGRMTVVVEVLDRRNLFGRSESLVRPPPETGVGECWVNDARLADLPPEAAAEGQVAHE